MTIPSFNVKIMSYLIVRRWILACMKRSIFKGESSSTGILDPKFHAMKTISSTGILDPKHHVIKTFSSTGILDQKHHAIKTFLCMDLKRARY